MKIIPSLKLYFVMMMIITGITTISIMSAVSFNYFVTGLDFSMNKTMRNQALKVDVSDGNPAFINDFVIASRWSDLPEQIQNNFNPAKIVDDELLKSIDGNPLFSRPKAGYFVLKLNINGEVRYISAMFIHTNHLDGEPSGELPPFIYLFMIALAAMGLFSLVPYIILRKVAHPIEKLMEWTKNLNKKQLTQTPPDFHYSELNSLAKIVQSSLQSVQESLDREQQFLAYASHELRTPIAVSRTNTELLRKMIVKEISVEKQLQVIDRIERAALNMTDLTETLLWLNRNTDKAIPTQNVSIGGLTQQLFEELTYLLNGKDVQVTIKTDQTTQPLPEALCRIIINNLIRNAFQHTAEGQINITQKDNTLVIENQNLQESQGLNELGFGLGLELTERIVRQYQWQYKNIPSDDGHYVEIMFK
jgi:signal transduction histidine kinase